jgi:hypothetical protein
MEPHNLNILQRHGVDTRQTPKDILTAVQTMMNNDDDDDMSSTASGHLQHTRPQSQAFGYLPPSPAASPQHMPGFSPQNNLNQMRQLSVSSVAVDNEETEICMFHLRGKISLNLKKTVLILGLSRI